MATAASLLAPPIAAAAAVPPHASSSLPVSRSATLPPAPTPPEAPNTTHAAVASLRSQGIDVRLATELMYKGIPITSPAALQYFGAAPDRPQVYLGDYLLLQTLGEGEFGKVKLGVHKSYGEEVAVKLIRRDRASKPKSLGEQSIKMSKIDREIAVLRSIRHPNIVRLYEVVTTDRYIGIVLEYASGGELFDHILAHKYLRSKDACRMFAQLISGVHYLHQKHIVHRDLKLENLLLDRNRNVIITDFGFANNFSNRANDLMATSCGSPCYAAPELVVQDGEYIGSAVDVWSCGVILYAMLAGYLPFDDDPANPDSDNINQLYHYILSTPITFPDYVPELPRHLLRRMLVPDPNERATMEEVMSHPWLTDYRPLLSFSVDDLERAASEQQMRKRQLYRQQMEVQQQLQRRPPASASPSGLQSSRPPVRGETLADMPTQTSHRQTLMPMPTAPSASQQRVPGPQLPSAAHVNRHTLQVEYSAPRPDSSANDAANPSAAAQASPVTLREKETPVAEALDDAITHTSVSSVLMPSQLPVVDSPNLDEKEPVSLQDPQDCSPRRTTPKAAPPLANSAISEPAGPPTGTAEPASVPATDSSPTPGVQAHSIQAPSVNTSPYKEAGVPARSIPTQLADALPSTHSALASAKAAAADQDFLKAAGGVTQPMNRSRSDSVSNNVEKVVTARRRRMSLLPRSDHRERRGTLFARVLPSRTVSDSPVSHAPSMAQQASTQSNGSIARSWRATLLPSRSADKDRRAPVRTKRNEVEARLPEASSASRPTFQSSSASPQSPTSKISTGPARRVMDWFRGRSRQVSEPIAGTRATTAPTPAPLQHTSRAAATHPPPACHQGHQDTKPSSRSTSGTHSNGSRDTHLTAPPEEPPTKRASVQGAATARDPMLRYHEGAVDQSALTSVPPGELMARVRASLTAMGIDFRLANQEMFKLECVRPKRGRGRGAWGALRTSLLPISQPGEPNTNDTNPIYGQADIDNGLEVRFSVEVTRLRNLHGLYSLDIRRMRGNVWAYKFCYTALLERCMVSEPSDLTTPTKATCPL